MKLGIIGLDSSHAIAFANILNNKEHVFHIPNHPITCAYPGTISPDFDMSYNRMNNFTKDINENYGVALVNSIEEVMKQVDAVFLEQVDARKRVAQFCEIASHGKPVFIDKPFALSTKDAKHMIEIAEKYNIPLLSTSSLRYADSLTKALLNTEEGDIDGADFAGPLPLASTQPGYFWYGVHTADMLFRTMGTGCESVYASQTENFDLVTGVWKDGRIGTIRGNRVDNSKFTGVIHRRNSSHFIDTSLDERYFYDSLLEQVIKMFDTGIQPESNDEMIEVTRFLEAANESLKAGCKIYL